MIVVSSKAWPQKKRKLGKAFFHVLSKRLSKNLKKGKFGLTTKIRVSKKRKQRCIPRRICVAAEAFTFCNL